MTLYEKYRTLAEEAFAQRKLAAMSDAALLSGMQTALNKLQVNVEASSVPFLLPTERMAADAEGEGW